MRIVLFCSAVIMMGDRRLHYINVSFDDEILELSKKYQAHIDRYDVQINTTVIRMCEECDKIPHLLIHSRSDDSVTVYSTPSKKNKSN